MKTNKRKTNKGKKFRKVYPYVCKHCDKIRMAFDNDRAKERICARCEQRIEYEQKLPNLFQ